MLLVGIVGHEDKARTANLISTMLSQAGEKVSIADSGSLTVLDPVRVKNYISELGKINVDILIVKINLEDIANDAFTNLHFDVLIYCERDDDLRNDTVGERREFDGRLLSMLYEKGIAIVNVDDTELIGLLHEMKHSTVTYGFNSKASITASSIGDDIQKDNFMCCLQRTISTRQGKLVEPQEYRIPVVSDDADAYDVLAAAAFAIVDGVDLNLVLPASVKPCLIM